MKTSNLRSSSELIDIHLSQLTELIYLVAEDHESAEIILHKTLSKLRSLSKKQKFQKYARVWVFHLASQIILNSSERNISRSASDGVKTLQQSLKCLPILDQLILIYACRFKFTTEEIAAILSIPTPTLDFQRDQALKTLALSLNDAKEKLLSLETEISPLTPPLPQKGTPAWKAHWEDAPWYLKTFLEGIGIAALVLTFVVVVPKLTALYDAKMNQRLDILDISNLDYASQPVEKTVEQPLPNNTPPAAPIEIAPNPEKVNDFESWDFTLLSDSPKELQSKIKAALIAAGLPPDFAGINGNEVPGGIHFDLVVSKSVVIAIKNEIDKVAVANLKSHAQNSVQDPYTFHKKKARQKITPGQTQLVVWLPQI